jgi:hypothetical protein
LGILKALNAGLTSDENFVESFSWPTTAEEYAVFAMAIQKRSDIREKFRPLSKENIMKDVTHTSTTSNYGDKINSVKSKVTLPFESIIQLAGL